MLEFGELLKQFEHAYYRYDLCSLLMRIDAHVDLSKKGGQQIMVGIKDIVVQEQAVSDDVDEDDFLVDSEVHERLVELSSAPFNHFDADCLAHGAVVELVFELQNDVIEQRKELHLVLKGPFAVFEQKLD